MIGGIARRARLAWRLLGTFGPRWLAFRLWYAVQLRAGYFRRRLPATSWDDHPLDSLLSVPALATPDEYYRYRHDQPPAFFFSPADRPQLAGQLLAWDSGEQTPIAEADEICDGVVRYFSRTTQHLGIQPNWHRNHFTGEELPANLHWSQIDDFGHGDIKIIWEPSRFGFTYPLVRAYWRTGDERYAERFWQLFESWRAANPPQQGPNWKCGQETSLRAMAWCLGLYGFLGAPATTPARVALLAQALALAGQRIEANLAYALSQRNNHGISEGMGLWTIGTLFPELRSAERWRERGRAVLEAQGRALLYDDGAFSQQSLNYQRLMLHDYLWCLRLGDIHGRPFSDELRSRVGRSGQLLHQLQDAATGQVPNYGHNDGALILPLSNCDYRDYRPIVQAVQYLTTGTRAYPNGAWDEDIAWLFGAEAFAAPVAANPRVDLEATENGYFTLRSPVGFAFLRCATYRDRPGQADQLHLDLWWRGLNIAGDAGTYSYAAAPPWDNPLAQTAYHNTITVDGLSQMDRLSSFLWVPWSRGKRTTYRTSDRGEVGYWEGTHDGYCRLADPVRHRRGVVRLGHEHWLVVDELAGVSSHNFRLHWLFPDYRYVEAEPEGGATGRSEPRLTLNTPEGSYIVAAGVVGGLAEWSITRADPETPRGWRSSYYLDREPALSLALTRQAVRAKFWTLLGPAPCQLHVQEDVLRIETETWRAMVQLGGGDAPVVAGVTCDGTIGDTLAITATYPRASV